MRGEARRFRTGRSPGEVVVRGAACSAGAVQREVPAPAPVEGCPGQKVASSALLASTHPSVARLTVERHDRYGGRLVGSALSRSRHGDSDCGLPSTETAELDDLGTARFVVATVWTRPYEAGSATADNSRSGQLDTGVAVHHTT